MSFEDEYFDIDLDELLAVSETMEAPLPTMGSTALLSMALERAGSTSRPSPCAAVCERLGACRGACVLPTPALIPRALPFAVACELIVLELEGLSSPAGGGLDP